jgi:hypothetical protein
MSLTPVRLGPEFVVNSITASNQQEPTITALADGRFVVAWTDYSASVTDTSGSAIRAQIYSANGTRIGAEFLVNTTVSGNQHQPSITALQNGGFVVGWTDSSAGAPDTSGSAFRAQIYGPTGTCSGGEFVMNTTRLNDQREAALTTLASGNIVATWTDSSLSPDDATGSAIRARIISPTGQQVKAEFLVNTITGVSQF